MLLIKCTKCMRDLEPDIRICPHCGFDQQGEAQPEHALRRNTILYGRYLVGNVIGQGGFGITYVGYDLKLDTKVAVKEYYPAASASRTGSQSARIRWDYGDAAEHARGIERFVKEARKMAKLDAVPSIVRVWDVFEDNETAYIVMDFVEGVTLKQYLREHGVMQWADCFALLEPILESLAVMHDRGFIHRDISPDNIMVQPDGTARLLDMGAAVDVRATQGQASMAVVKRNFSAPEQYTETEELGSWTDVYSMAATIYYCLTGRVVPEPMERTYSQKPIAFPADCHIPGEVKNALLGAMELSRNSRLRDMRMFRNRLTGENGTEPGTDSAAGYGETPVTGSNAAGEYGGADSSGAYPTQGYGSPQADWTGSAPVNGPVNVSAGKNGSRYLSVKNAVQIINIVLIFLFFMPTITNRWISSSGSVYHFQEWPQLENAGYWICLVLPILALVVWSGKKEKKKNVLGGTLLISTVVDLLLWMALGLIFTDKYTLSDIYTVNGIYVFLIALNLFLLFLGVRVLQGISPDSRLFTAGTDKKKEEKKWN
ncbi:MAG: serine/threonine protein kinase [Lachnospiraceae bacterium]|nr:serine/threonine protein kinase [Lachnospiraceae bacterium]